MEGAGTVPQFRSDDSGATPHCAGCSGVFCADRKREPLRDATIDMNSGSPNSL
jgi:hypothetical protein